MKPEIINGRLNLCRQVASPNFDDRPQATDISLLVIHSISLPPDEFGGAWIDALFTNTLDPAAHPYFAEIHQLKVSSHLLIRRNGEIVQYVPFNKRAWHAGESEFQGTENCNNFSIGIELEGSENLPFEEIQYKMLAEVTRTIIATYPQINKERITGHCDIAPGRKKDPGPYFDWDKFLSQV